MKPEQLEIDRLRKAVAKLNAERDILKNRPGPQSDCAGASANQLTRNQWLRKLIPPLFSRDS
ncbi:hypothetical protein X766_33625 [Mesorhizobium sp. LSJC255A00]|nr:hypothetical protein X766_33625 [Mesorhizobium sp. LSJC255A00]